MKYLIRFKVGRSIFLLMLFIILFLCVVLCFLIMNFPLFIKIIANILCLIYVGFIIKKHAFKEGSSSVVEFWQVNGGWMLKKYSGTFEKLAIIYPIFCSNNLIIMNFGGCSFNRKDSFFMKTTLIITRDSFEIKDNFRKLKILLQTLKGY